MRPAVLWELCTRELPVRGQIRDVRCPQEAPQAVADLIRECLDVDPARRPAMEDIIRRLTVSPPPCCGDGQDTGPGRPGSSLRRRRRPTVAKQAGRGATGWWPCCQSGTNLCHLGSRLGPQPGRHVCGWAAGHARSHAPRPWD